MAETLSSVPRRPWGLRFSLASLLTLTTLVAFGLACYVRWWPSAVREAAALATLAELGVRIDVDREGISPEADGEPRIHADACGLRSEGPADSDRLWRALADVRHLASLSVESGATPSGSIPPLAGAGRIESLLLGRYDPLDGRAVAEILRRVEGCPTVHMHLHWPTAAPAVEAIRRWSKPPSELSVLVRVSSTPTMTLHGSFCQWGEGVLLAEHLDRQRSIEAGRLPWPPTRELSAWHVDADGVLQAFDVANLQRMVSGSSRFDTDRMTPRTWPSLQSVELHTCVVGGQGPLFAPGGLPALETFRAEKTMLTGRHLAGLNSAPRLTTLDLDVLVPGELFADDREWPSLRELTLRSVDGPKIVCRGRFPRLERLNAESSGLAGTFLHDPAAFPALRSVNLKGCPVTDADVANVLNLPAADETNLACTLLTDEGVANADFQRVPARLDASGTDIGDAALRKLVKHRARQVGLAGTRCTRETIAALGGRRVSGDAVGKGAEDGWWVFDDSESRGD